MDETSNLIELLRRVERSMRLGNLDEAAVLREPLRAAIRSSAGEVTAEEQRCARILASHLFLERMEIGAAAEVLDIDLDRLSGQRALEIEDAGSAFLAGLFNAEVANLMFRRHAIDAGKALADLALEQLKTTEQKVSTLSSGMAWMLETLAHAWWARLAWQKGARASARERVDELIERAQERRSKAIEAQDEDEPEASTDLVLAIFLDLAAEFDATAGHTDAAADHARQGVLLLRESGAHDRPRLGHLLYVLGKIEARRGAADRYRFALQLLRSARDEYGPSHPFIFRTLNQEVQCLVRANEVKAAKKRLGDARAALDDAAHVTAEERRYAAASFEMTALWIKGREARQSSLDPATTAAEKEAEAATATALWKSCVTEVERFISRSGSLSSRLIADAQVQLGLAYTHLGNYDKALEVLHSAHDTAERKELVTIQIAALFLMAEASNLSSHAEGALESFNRACALIDTRGVQSEYLASRRQQVAVALRRNIMVAFSPRLSYADAEKQFKRTYLRYQLMKATSLAEFEATSKVPRPTLLRWLKELNMQELIAESGLRKSRATRE